MLNTNVFKLENCDPEDVGDTIEKVGKSFGLKFNHDDLKHVKTFGDLCDVVTGKMNTTNVNDCTSQQAFYKIREAIVETCFINRESVMPDTSLALIFPKKNRISQAREFEERLGIKVNILGIKNWLGWFIVACFSLSSGLLFINWPYALIAIPASIGIYKLSYSLGKELKINTVRQLTEIVAAEHYNLSRRNSKTYNKNEVIDIIKRIFINDLDIAESALCRDATF